MCMETFSSSTPKKFNYKIKDLKSESDLCMKQTMKMAKLLQLVPNVSSQLLHSRVNGRVYQTRQRHPVERMEIIKHSLTRRERNKFNFYCFDGHCYGKWIHCEGRRNTLAHIKPQGSNEKYFSGRSNITTFLIY